MNTEEQIKAEFKRRAQHHLDGFNEVQDRVFAEIRAEQRRRRFLLLLSPLIAAAAMLVVGVGIHFALSLNQKDLPLCPHSAKVEPPATVPTRTLNEEKEELFHLRAGERICSCSPRYSGSLR